MTGEKTLTAVSGHSAACDSPVEGYEMHIGRTDGPDAARPFARLDDGKPDGAIIARLAALRLHSSWAFRRTGIPGALFALARRRERRCRSTRAGRGSFGGFGRSLRSAYRYRCAARDRRHHSISITLPSRKVTRRVMREARSRLCVAINAARPLALTSSDRAPNT